MQGALAAFALAGSVHAASAPATEWSRFERPGGSAVEYAVVQPADAARERARPLLLALPPGAQDRAMVERAMELYWRDEALERGWIVVSPADAEHELLGAGAATALPAFLDHLAARFAIEGGRAHLAGPSNGGRAAFRAATLFPERFASLLALPGHPSGVEDRERLARLVELPVSFWVGGDDAAWVAETRAAERALRELDAVDVRVHVFAGEGHVPPSLTGAALFDRLDEHHARLLRRRAAERAATALLDELHAAAAEADGARYFACFAPGAVYLGTDASERWSVDAFRAWAAPYFAEGRGWTYVATERHVTLARGGDTAWFDERLDNAKYGEVRGSGVLVRRAGRWRVAQYNLAFPVPNELSLDLVERIRGLSK